MVIAVGANNRLTQTLKDELEKEMSTRGNKNLQQIPGCVEDHVQAQKRTELLFVNNFEALGKQEVKVKAEL